MSSQSNKWEVGSCIPIVAVKPTFMAYSKDGDIFDYSLTLVKKSFFFGHYSFAELSIKNIVTGEEERDTRSFTRTQNKELKNYMKMPREIFCGHEIDVLMFDGKKRMSWSLYKGLLALWKQTNS